jgi:hypothetical protein
VSLGGSDSETEGLRLRHRVGRWPFEARNVSRYTAQRTKPCATAAPWAPRDDLPGL